MIPKYQLYFAIYNNARFPKHTMLCKLQKAIKLSENIYLLRNKAISIVLTSIAKLVSMTA